MHESRGLRARAHGPVAVDDAYVVGLLRDLVRLPSVNPPGNEGPVAELLASHLRKLGLQTMLLEAQAGRPNLVAILSGCCAEPVLLLNGHMDVQPPGPHDKEPFSAIVREGALYGRGALDMKAGLAAMVSATKAVVDSGIGLRGTLMIMAVADEVSGGFQGTGYLVREHILKGKLPRPDLAVVCEPSGPEVRVAHRGTVWVEMTASGKPAPASRPWLGVNAIERLSRALIAIQDGFPAAVASARHWILPPPTLSVGVISGGVKANMVPEVCRAVLDRRTLPGEKAETIIEELLRVLRESEAVDQLDEYPIALQPLLEVEAAEVATTENIVRECQRAFLEITGREAPIGCTAGFEDAHFLIKEAGVPTAMFGPYYGLGNPSGVNSPVVGSGVSTPWENVHLGSVVETALIYAQLIGNVLGGGAKMDHKRVPA